MFSETLRELRQRFKLKQDQIAEILNVPCRTYGSWERNERQPDFETLLKIADFFQVSTDYLLGRVPMTVDVKKESPPPIGDDEMQLTFHIKDAPKDEDELEEKIRDIIRIELQAELAKRGL